MFANGNFSTFCPKKGIWTSINNKGMRWVRRELDNITHDITAIPCAYETCALTNSRVMFRDDGVISISYTDGWTYTVHKDGTKMFTAADSSEIVIEKEGLATVKVKLGVRLVDEEILENHDAEKQVVENYIS